MSAHVIVHLTPKDADKIAAYSAGAGETVAKFGGSLVTRGPAEALHGEHADKIAVIIEFPDRDTALGWYNSEEYQALIPNRDEAIS